MTILAVQLDPMPTFMPYDIEAEAIRAAGGVFLLGHCETEDDVLAQARDAEILLLSWKPIITARVMEGLPNCRLIVRWSVGYDTMDVAGATGRGIAIANSPTYATEAVAEETIALLMNGGRRVTWFHERMRAGQWPPALAHPIRYIRGRTLGIIGLGRIGSAVAWRARGLGLRVIAYDKYVPDDVVRSKGVEPRSFEQVLAESDFVSVHVPLTAETRHLMDAAAFARMKPGAFFINTSRGPVVDEGALVEVLHGGRVAGAGLDVFEKEPLPADAPIRQAEHAILLPHKAAYADESYLALRQEVCGTVANWIRDGWAPNVVNPEVRPNLRPRLMP